MELFKSNRKVVCYMIKNRLKRQEIVAISDIVEETMTKNWFKSRFLRSVIREIMLNLKAGQNIIETIILMT